MCYLLYLSNRYANSRVNFPIVYDRTAGYHLCITCDSWSPGQKFARTQISRIHQFNDCSWQRFFLTFFVSILQQNSPIRTHAMVEQAQVGARWDLTRMVALVLFFVMISTIQEHLSEGLAVSILSVQCSAFSINIALGVAPLLRFMSKLSTDHQIVKHSRYST